MLVLSLHGQDNEFQVLQARDAEAAAARHGLKLQVLYAENNAFVQGQQLVRLTNAPPSERPKAIIVEPVTGDGASVEKVARKAVAAGIGWVLLNSSGGFMEDLRRERPDLPIFTVASDQVEIGRIQAKQCRLLLPEGGALLYIEGPHTASAARDRLKGFKEALGGSGITFTSLDGQWTEASAAQAHPGLAEAPEFPGRAGGLGGGAGRLHGTRRPNGLRRPASGGAQAVGRRTSPGHRRGSRGGSEARRPGPPDGDGHHAVQRGSCGRRPGSEPGRGDAAAGPRAPPGALLSRRGHAAGSSRGPLSPGALAPCRRLL